MADCSGSEKSSCAAKDSCATSACMFSNARALSFFIPFVVVSFVYQLAPSGPAGATANAASSDSLITGLAPGVLAGATSLFLYSVIKAVKRKVLAGRVAQSAPLTADYMEKVEASAKESLAESQIS